MYFIEQNHSKSNNRDQTLKITSWHAYAHSKSSKVTSKRDKPKIRIGLMEVWIRFQDNILGYDLETRSCYTILRHGLETGSSKWSFTSKPTQKVVFLADKETEFHRWLWSFWGFQLDAASIWCCKRPKVSFLRVVQTQAILFWN